jgi:hypothetical protein
MTKPVIKKKSKPSNKLNKQLMLVSIKYVAEQVAAAKARNNGRVPWGFASKLLKEGHQTFPKMSMRTINNYIIRLEKEKKKIKK